MSFADEKTLGPALCVECEYYWEELEDTKKVGECRFNPPIVFFHTDVGIAGGHKTTNWPEVDNSEWCGKFERKQSFRRYHDPE